MKTERIIPFALLISAALVSCQKENINSPTEPEKSIQKTITIADTPWTGDAETKSFYEEGVGVHLNKLENMSVGYWKYVEGKTAPETEACPLLGGNNGKYLLRATAIKAGSWTFSHPEIDGTEKYNYFFVIPHTSKNEINGKNLAHCFRLSSVQSPEILNKFKGCESSQLSFDPSMDCHIGQAQYNVGIATEISDIHFKRLFTPLKLTINDSQNFLDGAPIYAVTLKSSAEATQKRTLTGIAWIRHSDNYDIANINSMDKNNLGNGVSTIYKTPIAKSGESYTTWFIVNPAELPAGELTISVTTATKTITRTVNSQILNIKADTINELKFDISKDNYTIESTDYYNFNGEITGFWNYAGSFNGAKPWTQNQMKIKEDDSYYNNAIGNGSIGSGKLHYNSQKTGKAISKVRFYGHPCIATKANTIKVVVKDKEDEIVIPSSSFNYSAIAKNGGYVEFDIPEAYANSNLTFLCELDYSMISAILLFHKQSSTSSN